LGKELGLLGLYMADMNERQDRFDFQASMALTTRRGHGSGLFHLTHAISGHEVSFGI
jgi:hypothetical protein